MLMMMTESKKFLNIFTCLLLQHMYFSRKNARKAGILLYIFSCSARYLYAYAVLLHSIQYSGIRENSAFQPVISNQCNA